MTSPSLPYLVSGGVALVDASAGCTVAELEATCRDAFADPGVHRIEVLVPAGLSRRPLHRAGFRLDGVLRGRLVTSDGLVDQFCYARLRADDTSSPAAFSAVMNTVTPRKRLIAHVLLTDPDGLACVLETSFKPDFELPGGILEPFESPLAGARRELQEELGADLAIGRLLVVDWLAPHLGWEDAVELVFDGGVLDSRGASGLVPDGREILAVHWLEPRAAAATMAPFAGGRLLGALAARAEGTTHYLEAGTRVS
ncbi:MAG TPA: NUDIX domain-containing protein [Propionicimonas sp.]|jgi:8-oxo-dGTP pyrophosphatase MutT (NUDIX family)|nr:NUDIX domain-containing protein [Propionicimonas sp.]